MKRFNIAQSAGFPCLALKIKKENTGSFSIIKIGQKQQDKIWDRNPSKSLAVE